MIDNLSIQFDMPYKVTNIWNGVVPSNKDGTYVIKTGH